MSNLKVNTFLAQWIAIVTVVLTLALIGAFLTSWSVSEAVEQRWGETAAALIVGALFGGLLAGGTGFAQAAVLFRQGIKPGPWILRTVVAGTVGMAIGMTIAFTTMDLETMPDVLVGLYIGLSVGAPVGHAQSSLLKKHLNRARLWIPITALAFSVGFVIGLSLSGESREWLALGTAAVITAIISGVGFVWLARATGVAVAA